MLRRLGVESIVMFSNGQSALSYLNSVEQTTLLPNLILTDLNMPVMNGFELMGNLRDIVLFETPPMVMACSGTS